MRFRQKEKAVADAQEHVAVIKSCKRNLGGIDAKVVYIWSIFGAFLNLYSLFIAKWTLQVHMALSLMFTMSLTFLVYKKNETVPSSNHEKIAIYDWILAIIATIPNIYIVMNWKGIIDRVARPTSADMIMAALLILLILECCRRTMGNILPLIALIFTAYVFLGKYIPGSLGYRGTNLKRYLAIQFMSTEGVFSSPTQTSSKMIFIFTLFGAFLVISGGGDKLMDIAFAFAGRFTGGPAKVAVVSSGLMGMVSGSASANVATTGQFTIPMMKKLGFSSQMAGAVEAVASTGGTLAPPVMGAGAFIMAEMLGISYFDVIKAATIPAIIYYICAFFVIHFEAKRLGLIGLPQEELPSKKKSIIDGMIVIIPIAILLTLIFRFYPVMRSALIAMIAIVIISWFYKDLRMTPKKILDALSDGMVGLITLSMCCATAGIVVGCIQLTGLGAKFASVLSALSNGYSFVSLILGMIVVIILGMGLPATAAYVVGATVVGPALLKMGFDPLPAQMFIFYYSCLAQITPPIALASYVGASIAECDPLKCALTSMRLGLVALIIPFMFIYNPTLLWVGSGTAILFDLVVAIIGVIVCACGLAGFFASRLNTIQRLICVLGGLLLIIPGIATDIIGVIIAVIALASNVFFRKRLSE